LRRWHEGAGVSRKKLAERLGLKENTISDKLSNPRNWKASDNLLRFSLQVVELSGGAPIDLENWTKYHNAVFIYQSTEAQGELPMPPEPAGRAVRKNQRWTKRRTALSASIAVILVASGIIWIWINSNSPIVKIEVVSNPDELVTTPALRDAMGNYATSMPIAAVPPPPDGRDSCNNRYKWAHSEPINAVDAGSSIAKVDITALKADIRVDRAALHRDPIRSATPVMTLLACPGRGGPTPPHLMALDLDSGERVFFPDGGNTPGNFDLRIAQGHTESILVVATALESHSLWRLELGGDDGESSFEYSIGPDEAVEGRAASNPPQRPFETIGELLATPYRFRDGAWQLGR
jgi:hypothetical protein